jgi:hypothetical protein
MAVTSFFWAEEMLTIFASHDNKIYSGAEENIKID